MGEFGPSGSLMRDRLQGIVAPVPTAFDATGRVDRGLLGDNVRRLMQTRLSGVLALGSNGEAALLDDAEGDAVLEAVRDVVPRDRLLLAGTGRESTRLTIAATRRAASIGADAVLVRTPSFFKAQMTPEALLAHFSAIADAATVPVLLYNLPGVTGVSLTLAVVSRLAAHPNVVGLKETSADLERLAQFAALDPAGFRVFSGWAPVVYPALMSGAAGGILAVANVLPDACVELYEHAHAGRHEAALALQRRLIPIAQLVSTVHGVAGLKVALELMGCYGGPVRAPLLAASSRTREQVAAALAAFQGVPTSH
jgi:4-hydroxy-tetrahydrodipicolinate synthase